MATSELQSSIAGAPERPLSAPPINGTNPPGAFLSANGSTPAGSSFSGPLSSSTLGVTGSSKAKGMQLGAHKSPNTSALEETLATENVLITAPGAWDDEDGGDLIDVAADTGDWSRSHVVCSTHIVCSRLPGDFARAPGAPELEKVYDPDAWGDMLDSGEHRPSGSSPPPAAMPNLSSFAPAPRKAVQTKPKPATPKAKANAAAKPLHSTPSGIVTPPSQTVRPAPSPAAIAPAGDADGWGDDSAWVDGSAEVTNSGPQTTPLSAMTKEEKAAEMARRKEERKQVWPMLI